MAEALPAPVTAWGDGNAPPQQNVMQVPAPHAVSTRTSYTMKKGTKLWDLLEAGAFNIVKGQYFVDRFARKEPIQMRQDIAPEYVWTGPEVVKRWQDFGPNFLVAVSYAWLDKETPDPELFHLERLAQLVQEHRKENLKSWAKACDDIGVVFDYCCFSQKKLVNGVDSRTPEEKAQLKAGLEEINTIYGHASIYAWRLEQVPDSVARKYADRGWTLFESVIIDGTAAFVLTFDAVGTRSLKRGPPLTPERFERELDERSKRAREKGVNLFTNGKEDFPLVIRKYRDSFAQLTAGESISYLDEHECDWGAEEVDAFIEALPFFKHLYTLQVPRLPLEQADRVALVIAKLLNAGEFPYLYYLHGFKVGPEAGRELRLAWRRRNRSLDCCLEETFCGVCRCCWGCGAWCGGEVSYNSKTY